MADPSQPDRITEDEGSIANLPPVSEAVSSTHDNTATHDEPRSHSPATVRTVPRRNSSVSHVSLDYFDPSGVAQLRRTMSHMSAAVDTNDIPEVPFRKIGSRSTVDTTTTLAAPKGNEPFDLEKTLRTVMKRYFLLIHSARIMTDSTFLL